MTDRKGQIFSIDAVLALFLIIGAVVAAGTMMRHSAPTDITHLQSIGGDMAALLQDTGALGTLQTVNISDVINRTLPQQYALRLAVECKTTPSFDIGPAVPDDRQVAGGERFFLSADLSDQCVARWRLWSR